MPAIHTLALTGEVDMAAVEQSSAELLAEVAALRADLLIVDVSALTFIDGSGMAMLNQLREQQSRHGGRLALYGASPMLSKTLTITGMDRIMPVYGRRPAAIDPAEPTD